MLKTIEKHIKKSGLAFRNGYEYVSYGKFGNKERELANLDKSYLLDTEYLQFELSFKLTDSFSAEFEIKELLGRAKNAGLDEVDSVFENKKKYKVAIATTNKKFFEDVIKAIIPIAKTIIETANANVTYDLTECENEI